MDNIGKNLLNSANNTFYTQDLDNIIKDIFNEIKKQNIGSNDYNLDIHLLYQMINKKMYGREPFFIKQFGNITNDTDIDVEILKMIRPLKKISDQSSNNMYKDIYNMFFEKAKDIITRESKNIQKFDVDLKSVIDKNKKEKIEKKIDGLIDCVVTFDIKENDSIKLLEELLRIRYNSLKSTWDDNIPKSEKTYIESVINCITLTNRIAHEFDSTGEKTQGKNYFAYKDICIQNVIAKEAVLKKDGVRIFKDKDKDKDKVLVVAQKGFPLTSVHCPRRSFNTINSGNYKKLEDFPLASSSFISPLSYSSDPEYLKKNHGSKIIIPFNIQPYHNWTDKDLTNTVKKIFGDVLVSDCVMFNTLSVTGKFSVEHILLLISRMKDGNNTNELTDFSKINNEFLLYPNNLKRYKELCKISTENSDLFQSLIGTDLINLLTNCKNEQIMERISKDNNIDENVKKDVEGILKIWQCDWQKIGKEIYTMKDFIEKKIVPFIKDHKQQTQMPKGDVGQLAQMTANAGVEDYNRASSFSNSQAKAPKSKDKI